ncbi:MAG: VOC family protein [Xanthomonadales bacterium]|nr:VOC family protein [Xanthomonadales bacterium]
MIGYVTLGTNQYENAVVFYDDLLGSIGAGRFMEGEYFTAWAVEPGQPGVCVIRPHNGEAATVGNGTMVALAMKTPEQVDALYKKALALGGTDEGEPGPRGEGGFYAGYFRDLDGNKLNAFCMVQ